MNRTLEETREMKGSGIEWIGLIPKEWEVRKLDSISKTITDFVASGSFAALRENVEYKDEPDYAMLVRTVDLSNNFNNSNIYITKKSYEFLSNSNLYGGELILSNIGSVGNVYYFQPKYKRNSLASNSIMVITNYCNKFYYYWFLSPLGNQSLINLSNSAVQMKFNKTQLRALRVPLPPLHEQQAIANYLDEKVGKIDELIAEQKTAIENWKSYKQSLITETVTKGLNPNVEMKDSGIEWIGKIPKEWEVNKIKRMCYLKGRIGWQGLKASEFIEDGPYLVTGTDFKNGRVEWESCYHISNERFVEAPEIHLKKDDLLITKDGTIGKLAYIDFLPGPTSLNSHLLLIRPTNNQCLNKFLFWMFSSSIFKFYTGLAQGGSIMESLSQKKIGEFSIPLPQLQEQQAIADFLDEKCSKIDQTIEQKQTLIKQLEEYKQSLIYECVTGKRCVL